MHRSVVRPMGGRRSQHFVDSVKVLLSSGPGGDGASVMSHEHGNEFAGPGGGNGGNGGSIMLRCSKKVTDLSHIQHMGSQISAMPGSVGFARTAHGKRGSDLWIELPVGTEVIDVDTNEVVYDVDTDGVELLLLEGGQGGKGNAAFANKWNHSPTESTRGLPGNTMLAQLELKIIADVGLIGYPNAGKSSLLSAISRSKPTVAPYAFTTLRPYVGVIHDLYGSTCRVADLPGLIEGAYENRGLGHQFLRHVERTQSLAYVVDMSDSFTPSDTAASVAEPWEVVEALQRELEYYLPGLSDRALMVFANKMDLHRDSRGALLTDKLEELRRRVRLPVFPISAALGIALGVTHAQTGLAPALQLLCEEVFRRKKRREEIQRNQANMEAFSLDKTFHAKYRGVFASQDGVDEAMESDGVSLVDQQLDMCGASGLGSNHDDGYQRSTLRGKLHDYRDLTMKGRYWSLTRRNGEKKVGMGKREREESFNKERCLAYVRRLWEMDQLGMFHHPVGVTELPDYHKVIKCPIDLTTIRKKIDSDAYNTDADMQSDVALMISNALEYNAKGSEWHSQAREFRASYLDWANQSGLCVDADAAYIPSKSFKDDESTIRKAEKNSGENIDKVLTDLEADKEVPLDELMARYKRSVDTKEDKKTSDDEDDGDDEEDSDDEDDSNGEEEEDDDSYEDDDSDDDDSDEDEDEDDE